MVGEEGCSDLDSEWLKTSCYQIFKSCSTFKTTIQKPYLKRGRPAIPGVRHSGGGPPFRDLGPPFWGPPFRGPPLQDPFANQMSACGHPRSLSHVDDKKHASKLCDGLPEISKLAVLCVKDNSHKVDFIDWYQPGVYCLKWRCVYTSQ